MTVRRAEGTSLFHHLGALVLFVGLWWLLSGEDRQSWIVGVPTIILAWWVFSRSRGAVLVPVRLGPLVSFLRLFFNFSVRGSVDVARRVLSREMDIDPGVVRFTFTKLAPGGGRLLFVAVIGLCPGTLCFDLGDDSVSVHVLDRNAPINDELCRVEAAIAALFGPVAESA